MVVKYLDSCYVGGPQNETIGRIGIPRLCCFSSCSEINSTGYPEFDEPIRERHQCYPLF